MLGKLYADDIIDLFQIKKLGGAGIMGEPIQFIGVFIINHSHKSADLYREIGFIQMLSFACIDIGHNDENIIPK